MGKFSTIPIGIAPAAATPDAQTTCGKCLHAGLHADGERLCVDVLGEACDEAMLSGPSDELQRVLAALGRALGFAPEKPELGGVRSLRLSPGEVQLQLAAGPHCGATERLDTAFQTLRALLPDTDIYVTPG